MTDTGFGTPLVLLHAFPVDSRMWRGVEESLVEHIRVIAPDQRGMGKTPLVLSGEDGERLPEPSLDVVAADVLRELDERGLDRVLVGGCSMGGYVAMALLRAAPHRVAGLLLVDTRAGADGPEQRANRLAAAERAEREGVGWLADTMLPNLLGDTTHRERPHVVATAQELVRTQPAAGVAWAQRAMAARPDSTDLLRRVQVPTLVVVGEEDRVTPPEVAQDLAGSIPDAELVVLPRCGHLPPLEDPDAFAEVTLAWVRRVAERV